MIKSIIWFLVPEKFYIKLFVFNINCIKDTEWFHKSGNVLTQKYRRELVYIL